MIRILIKRLRDGQELTGQASTIEEAEKTRSFYEKQKDDYEIEFIDENEYDRDRKMSELIQRRDAILKATDWLFMSDVKTEQKHRRIYMEYRQYLRDLPSLIGNKDVIGIEEFPHYLRRKHPEEFMDGGDNKVILHRFMYYYKNNNVGLFD